MKRTNREYLILVLSALASLTIIPVTISLGVAEYQQAETSDSWLKRADDALYQAKENGRNQICIAD